MKDKICAVVCCKMEVLCKFLLAIIGIFINLTSSSFLLISSFLFFAILFIAEINYFFPNFYINPEILSYSDNQVFYYIYSVCGVIWLIDRITGITNKIHVYMADEINVDSEWFAEEVIKYLNCMKNKIGDE